MNRQRSVFFLQEDGGYDGNWPVTFEGPNVVFAEPPIPGYATREDAQAAVDAFNERARRTRQAQFHGDIIEVRVP